MCVCVSVSLSIYLTSSLSIHLLMDSSCFHVLAVINCAAVNTEVHVSFWIMGFWNGSELDRREWVGVEKCIIPFHPDTWVTNHFPVSTCFNVRISFASVVKFSYQTELIIHRSVKNDSLLVSLEMRGGSILKMIQQSVKELWNKKGSFRENTTITWLRINKSYM